VIGLMWLVHVKTRSQYQIYKTYSSLSNPRRVTTLHRNTIKTNLQSHRMTEFLSTSHKLIDIPIDPHKLALEELGFGASEPDVEMARQLDCRRASKCQHATHK
jgi:hypothetical protein